MSRATSSASRRMSQPVPSPGPFALNQNFIGGRWIGAAKGETFEDRNPANTDDLIGVFPRSREADVDAAVSAAKSAFKSWHLVPAPQRGNLLRKCADVLAQRKEELAVLMAREMGKPLVEARGDVQEAID